MSNKDKFGVETSVIDQYGAPDVSDDLSTDIPETKAEANSGLVEAEDAATAVLEGDTIVQWDAEYTVDSETEAAVADGADKPHPAETVGEEEANAHKGVKTSVVNKYAAPNFGDDLRTDIPETKAETKAGLAEATDAATAVLEGETIEQHIAEGDVFSQTEAAVANGADKPHPAKTVGEEQE